MINHRWLRDWGFVFVLWLKRDLKSRYTGSFGGALWGILNPLMTVAVFYVVFAVVLKIRIPELASESGYFYFLLAGLLPWMGISEGLSRAVGSLVAQEQFIQKLVFPIEIIPATVVVSSFVTQLVGLLILLALLAAGGVLHLSSLVWLPFLFIAQLILCLGMGMLFAILTVHVKDLAQLVPVFLQVFFYLTPIIYARSMVPAKYHYLYAFNPFAGLIDLYQRVFLGLPLNPDSALSLAIWVLIAGAGGLLMFRALKPTLGDYL
ncbi:MAG: ABC transporter permease [Sulfuricella denitrificans]|nr:ABC transporter permease [Sulfuricella denitrificans]